MMKRSYRSHSRKKGLWLGLGLAAGAIACLLRRRSLAARRQAWKRRMALGGSRIALVTGASSGIGRVYADRLAAQGYHLVLVARRVDRLEALAEQYRRTGGVEVEVLPADLSAEEGIARVEQRIAARGDIDFLVNNAGYDEFGPFERIPREKILGLINCLALATVRLSHAALPGMLERRRGAIVNVSSIGAFGPKPRDTAYVSTKAFVNRFSESLSIELAGSGVRVQCLCPGFTDTEFHDAPQYAPYRIKERVPPWLWMRPEAVVAASLRGLEEDRRIVVPGWQNQLIFAGYRTGLAAFMLGVLRSYFKQEVRKAPGRSRRWVEHWSRFAGEYDEKVSFVTGAETPDLLREKLRGAGRLGRALELGCGTGAYTAAIAAQAESVLAIDPSPELLAVAREKLAGIQNVEFRLADLERLDLPPDSFDAIVLFDVLTTVDAPRVLAQCRRLLRQGGKLHAAHFTLHGAPLPDRARFAWRSWRAFGLPPGGRQDYSLAELAGLARQAGFAVQETGLVGRGAPAAWLSACKTGGEKTSSLSLLACPQCRGELALSGSWQAGVLTCASCRREYPVQAGIPRFIRYAELAGLNRRFARFYDWFSLVYLPFSRLSGALLGGEGKIRSEILDRLDPQGGRVLEVSIGPGVNLPYLVANPAVGEIYGLDISLGQLQRCQRFAGRHGYPVELYLGMAEALPFKDESFASVFHVGGINFFSDKQRAIAEMIRVAQPGAKIVIADETERGARGFELSLPGFRRLFEGRRRPVRPPVDLVPPGMLDLRLDESIWKGWFYCIEFRKPPAGPQNGKV